MNSDHVFVGQLKINQCQQISAARVAEAFGASFCMIWEIVKGSVWGFLIFFENPMTLCHCEECPQTETWNRLLPACTLKGNSLFYYDGGQVRTIWLGNLISNPTAMLTHGNIPFNNAVMTELLFSIQNEIIALLTDQLDGKQGTGCGAADDSDLLDLAD